MTTLLSMQHRIRKLQDVMDILDSSDSTVQTVVDRLLPLYKEYQMERKELLHATVKEALLIITKSSMAAKPMVALSLNQSMQNQYSRSGSKRSRPDEETVTIETDQSKPDVSILPTLEKEQTGKVNGTPKKKKAVSFKGEQDGSAVGNSNQVDLPAHCL